MDWRWGRKLWAVHIAEFGTILVCIWVECHRAAGGGQQWSLGGSVGGSSSISMSSYGSSGKDSNSRLLHLNGEAETGSPVPSLHPLCMGNVVGMIEGCKMVWMIDMSGIQWGMLGNIFWHAQGVEVSWASQRREAS